MKTKLFIVLVVILSLFGCASVGTIKDFNLVDPLGVITITANSEIGWYGAKKESGGLLNKLASKALNDKKNETASTLLSRTDILVDKLDKKLQEKLSNVSTVSVTSKSDITSSSAYSSIDEGMAGMLSDRITAEGYKKASYADKNVASSIAAETGVKGLTYIDVSFSKGMNTGVAKTGTLKAIIEMTVTIADEKGKMIFTKMYYGQSEDTIAVAAGIYDPKELAELFTGVIDNVCAQFVAEFNM